MENIQLLDATLRDGGQGLEDAYRNKIDAGEFSDFQVKSIINDLQDSRIEIIELGSMKITDEVLIKYNVFKGIEQVSTLIPKNQFGNNPFFVALYNGPDTPYDDIPEWHPGLCQGVRLIIRYSEIDKSLQFCEMLSSKGYSVFIQPMLTMRYTDEELEKIVNSANKMNAYALYIVDSYGYMMPSDIARIYKFYNKRLKPNIRIGFHSHNNMNLAFSNTLSFIEHATSRNIIVDSTIIGMGQGSGNVQTELLTYYMNEHYGKNYQYNPILDACEIIETFLNPSIWGYSVTRLLPAIHKTAYKYAISLRNYYHLSLVQINDLFSHMPNDMRHRYTEENVILLLKSNGYKLEEMRN